MGDGVCVVGSLAWDLSAAVERLPRPGETVLAAAVRSGPGGKGSNQAIASARAGARTSMVGSVGEDSYGAALLDVLAAEGVDCRYVSARPDVPTGMAFPVVDAQGQNTVVVSLGANDAVRAANVERAHAAISGAAVVLVQLELPDEAVVAAAQAARQAGIPVLLNPAPARALPPGLTGLVDVLVPNEMEACLLLGRDELGDPADAVAAVRDRCGVHIAVLTLAERGAVVCDATGVRAHASPPVTCVDSVGAGDTFCGYLAAGLAADLDVDAAVARAVAAGALAVTARGAAEAVPRADAVTAMLAGADVQG